jgi:neutral ceramidase
VKMNPGLNNPKVGAAVGPVDPAVTVLAVRTAEGKPLAAYCVYGLHYVGDLPPLSADYFGVFCSVLGPKLGAGPGFVAALANGTSGDVNNVDTKAAVLKSEPGERSRAVAELVATAAAKAFGDAKPAGELSYFQRELSLGVRKPSRDVFERSKKIVAAAKERRTAAEVYAYEQLKLQEFPEQISVPLQVLTIGDFHFCAIPCEVFAEIGLAMKKKRPRSQIVSLANGYFGYLPTAAQHELGGYETWLARSSYLEKNAAAKIVTGLEGLMK